MRAPIVENILYAAPPLLIEFLPNIHRTVTAAWCLVVVYRIGVFIKM
jgi:hypothetical protein